MQLPPFTRETVWTLCSCQDAWGLPSMPCLWESDTMEAEFWDVYFESTLTSMKALIPEWQFHLIKGLFFIIVSPTFFLYIYITMIVKTWPARGVLSSCWREGAGRCSLTSENSTEWLWMHLYIFFTSPQELLNMGMRFDWGLGVYSYAAKLKTVELDTSDICGFF